MIWSCDYCGTILPLWKMRCPNCKKSAISWLHIAAVAIVGGPALFILAKLL